MGYNYNDWRDYQRTDDYLAHYGVKGMKWGEHLKSVLFLRDNRVNRSTPGSGIGGWIDRNVTGSSYKKTRNAYLDRAQSSKRQLRDVVRGYIKSPKKKEDSRYFGGLARNAYTVGNARKKAAVEEQKKYNKTLFGRVEKTARAAAKTGSKALNGAKKFVGNSGKAIAKKSGKLYNNGKNFVSNLFNKHKTTKTTNKNKTFKNVVFGTKYKEDYRKNTAKKKHHYKISDSIAGRGNLKRTARVFGTGSKQFKALQDSNRKRYQKGMDAEWRATVARDKYKKKSLAGRKETAVSNAKRIVKKTFRNFGDNAKG